MLGKKRSEGVIERRCHSFGMLGCGSLNAMADGHFLYVAASRADTNREHSEEAVGFARDHLSERRNIR